MKPAALILSAACGMFAGMWLGAEHTANPAESKQPNPREMSSRRRVHVSNGHEKRSFKVALARFELSGGLPDAGMKAVERADTAELREWLVSLGGEKIDDRDFFARRSRYGMLTTLASELYRREGAEAVRWADGTRNELLFLSMLAEMGREDLAGAKSWLPAYQEKGQSPPNPVFYAALQGAAMRGADELLILENTEYSESGATRFADDFDFRTYVAGTKSSAGLDESIRYWAALNPEAVANALREKIGVRNGYWRGVYAKAYQARAAMAGEAEAARWIWPVLEELSAREKRDVYPGVLSDDPAMNLSLFQTIPDDAARVDFLSCALPGSGYVSDEALDLLKELKSEALRVQTIERWLENHEKYPPASLRQSLEKLVDHAGLSPASGDALRAKIPNP